MGGGAYSCRPILPRVSVFLKALFTISVMFPTEPIGYAAKVLVRHFGKNMMKHRYDILYCFRCALKKKKEKERRKRRKEGKRRKGRSERYS